MTPAATTPSGVPSAVPLTLGDPSGAIRPRGVRAVPVHLADLSPAERDAAVRAAGFPGFRARQLAHHYFARYRSDPSGMTDLPAGERDALAALLLPRLLEPAGEQRADGGDTVKSLWRLSDGALVESVLMRYPDRLTLCLSSQAGCGIGCPFCATGQQGLTRNLTTAEIVDQAVRACARAGERLDNVVFMGMGEPLANADRVIGAVRRLTEPAPAGLGMSARSVTVSTVGLVPAVDRLAGEGLPVTLALSLHAPDDDLRDELVPVNSRYPVADVLDAARRYFRATRRRVSIEYALIRDVNDQAWRAELLARELRARGKGWVHVNPIPLNPTPGSRWTASDHRVAGRFVAVLRGAGIPTTVRDTRGRDIDGACGQLAASSRPSPRRHAGRSVDATSSAASRGPGA
ncbi:MAG: 23S rRNA (adenine(2503)-C(2))-methyltransferase RlmN [Kineosporiaceae bacterium]